MSRYIRGAKPLYVETPLWDDVEPHRPNLTVDGAKVVDTGLLYPDGSKVMRVANPVGFGRDREWE